MVDAGGGTILPGIINAHVRPTSGYPRAAEACGQEGELGTLEPGKLADMVIVDGDPLTDVQVMSRVVTVIKGGEVAYRAKR